MTELCGSTAVLRHQSLCHTPETRIKYLNMKLFCKLMINSIQMKIKQSNKPLSRLRHKLRLNVLEMEIQGNHF